MIRPILFNTEMVIAILEDRKTATRRLIKPQPTEEMKYKLGYCVMGGPKKDIGKFGFGTREWGGRILCVRPPALIGDILYVRETWCNANKVGAEPDYYYYADTRICEDYERTQWKWRPSIHMPKEAARIWLKVTDIKVERICNMLQSDFLDEGIELYKNDGRTQKTELEIEYEFEDLWNSTVKKTERDLYGWDANPWVWAINFERVEKPEK